MSSYKPKYDASLDGVTIQRANAEFNKKYQAIYATDFFHYADEQGNILCDADVTSAFENDSIPVCPDCNTKAVAIYDKLLAAEVKGYWLNPSGGSAVRVEPVVKRVKAKVEHKQLEMLVF